MPSTVQCQCQLLASVMERIPHRQCNVGGDSFPGRGPGASSKTVGSWSVQKDRIWLQRNRSCLCNVSVD